MLDYCRSKQDEGVAEVQRLRESEAQLRETMQHLHNDKVPEASPRTSWHVLY